MRLRNITGSREVIAESPYVVPEDTLESCPGTGDRTLYKVYAADRS